MPNDIPVYILIPAIGVILLLAALLQRARLAERNVVKFNSERLGFGINATAFGLMMLLGAGMVAVPAWFKFQGYGDRLKTLEGRTQALQATVEQLNMHSMRLKLDFPNPDETANPLRATIAVFVNNAPRSADKIDRGVGGIVVSIGSLRAGDQLRVEVDDDGRKWRSDDMAVPEANLRMSRVSQ